MTQEEKLKLIGWWWGRTLPEDVTHLRNLSNLNDVHYEVLLKFKNLYEDYQKRGIWVNWGHQVTAKEFFNAKNDGGQQMHATS